MQHLLRIFEILNIICNCLNIDASQEPGCTKSTLLKYVQKALDLANDARHVNAPVGALLSELSVL